MPHPHRYTVMAASLIVTSLTLVTGCVTATATKTPVAIAPATPAPVPQPVVKPDALTPSPNIVMVMADDMRVDDLDFAPHLRRLARHGITFENSFSPYPLT